MKSLGLHGVRRGKVKRTTIADTAAHRPRDLVERRFGPLAPNLLWVADITYVSTWSGWVYVAFVTDAYARRILGWRTSTSMSTPLVLDAVEHAIWTRGRHGVADLGGVIHHTDAGSQYTAVRFCERLAEAGISASVGSVGDSFDNALAETVNGYYKAELIYGPARTGPWKTVEDVELATLGWVYWHNTSRLHSYLADVPPTEFEAAFYDAQRTDQPLIGIQ